MTVHWNREGGVVYTSRRGEVRGVTEAGKAVTLGSFTNSAPRPTTTIDFVPTRVRSIQLYQPSDGGAAERPGLMWLQELVVQ